MKETELLLIKVKKEYGICHAHLTKRTVIKPCPFCGAKRIKLEHTHTAYYWMECSHCGASIHGVTFGNGEERVNHAYAAFSAISSWNMRVEASDEKP